MAAAKSQPSSVDKLKSYESQLSTVFGFIIVVAIGVGLLFLLRRSTMTPTPKISDLGGQTAEDLMKDEDKKAGQYTVKAGDNLWKIAESQLQNGYQWTTIALANGIKSPYVVTEGQTITIPTPDPKIENLMAKASASPAPAATSAPVATSKPEATIVPATSTPEATKAPESRPQDIQAKNPSTGEHTVVSGESLWKIAQAEYNDGYKWVEIYKANKDLIGKNPGIIIAGQKLTLPSLK